MKKFKYLLAIIILVFADQITKYFIIVNKNNLPKEIIKGVLNFTYCENRGIAFGIGQGSTLFISIITAIIIIAILIYTFAYFYKIDKLMLVGISLLISGGIGNLIDRIFRKYVIDYINIGELFNFPIFNIADMCVVVGIIIIAIACLKKDGSEKIEGASGK